MLQALSAFFILLFTFQNSEAQGLRCFDLFAQHAKFEKPKHSADFYAEALDSLNEKYNRFLFTENLSEALHPQLDALSFFEATQARYNAFRLKRKLIQLHEFDSYLNPNADRTDVYALEKLAVKLEKLTFLNDTSLTHSLGLYDRAVLNQARHSLFAGGLQNFLFSGAPMPSPGVVAKMMTPFRVTFKEVYLRWVFAMGYMPKLNGAVIPFEIIEKVVLNGYEANKDLLKPYLVTTRGKAFFNVFSSSYNYILAGILAYNAVELTRYTYQDVYLKGIEKAVTILTPMMENAQKLESTDFKKLKQQHELEISIQKIRDKYNREPLPEEIEILKSLIQSKDVPASQF